MHTLMGLYEDVRIRGGAVRSDVLNHTIAPASTEVAGQLGIPANSPVMVLQRMRFVGGEPWALSTAWLPEHVRKHTVDGDMTRESLNLVLEGNGIFGATGCRSVEDVRTDEVPAARLETQPRSALLKIRSVCRDEQGAPLEYFEALHRGDHSRFEFELTRDETFARIRTNSSPMN